jgi:hypothetical protein
MFFMILLSCLGLTLLSVADTEHLIAYNSLWTEGAMEAADAGVNVCLAQITANPASSVPAVATTTLYDQSGTRYQYRSGQRTGGPTPLTEMGVRSEPGYSLAVGTGYNPSGYKFHMYQFNVTGTGPRNATRELQVRAEYGPVAQ